MLQYKSNTDMNASLNSETFSGIKLNKLSY